MYDAQPIQRRIHRRHAVSIACEAVREEGFVHIGGRLIDLSDEGCFVQTSTIDLAFGEEVFLSFKAPRSRQWVDAIAVVTRRSKGLRHNDHPQGLGLCFIEMSAMDRAILSASLLRLPPPLPTRRRPVDYAAYVRELA